MKQKLFIFILLTIPSLLGVDHEPPADQMAKTYFGFSLTKSYQSGLITYALIKVHKGKIVSKKLLRKDVFVQMIVGRIPSAANIERKNLFVEHNLDTCVVYVDDIQNKYTGHICKPLDQLWKIKYREHPEQHGLGMGWSQEYYSPSMKQLQFLNSEFKVWNTNQYFWGPKMWDLLQKVMDPNWISRYKSADI